jgi:CxxC-x17-CxxC domain-containing protein
MFEPRIQPKLYDAVCSECGQKCQLSFNPDPTRKVFCRECFRRRQAAKHNFSYGTTADANKVWARDR